MPGIECQANQGAESEGCTVAWGICNVSFTSNAADSSTPSTSTASRAGSRRARVSSANPGPKLTPVCPLDNRQWELQRYGR
jgi:RING-box protein 1